MDTVKVLAKVPAKTNGTAAPAAPVTAAKVAPLATEPKPQKPEGSKVESIEDRLHRLNMLFDLQKKYTRLQEAKKELTDFTINANKENSELELTDDEGNSFTTKNPVIIAAAVKTVLDMVNAKSDEIGAQIVL